MARRDGAALGPSVLGCPAPGRLSTRLLWQWSSFGQPDQMLGQETSLLPQPAAPLAWVTSMCRMPGWGEPMSGDSPCPKHRAMRPSSQIPLCHPSCRAPLGTAVPWFQEGGAKGSQPPCHCLCCVYQSPSNPAEESSPGSAFTACPAAEPPGTARQGRRWEASKQAAPGFPLPVDGGRVRAAPPGLPEARDAPEFSRKEEQAAACTILALGPSLCESNCFLPLLPTLWRAINTSKHTLHCTSCRRPGVPCHPCSTPSLEKPALEELPSCNWASLSSPMIPPLRSHRRDPAHAAIPACSWGFGRCRSGSSRLTNPDGLSLGKAERSTDRTPWAVCMLGSKNKPLPISIKFPSLCFASWEHAARLWQSLLGAGTWASPGRQRAESGSMPSSRPTCAAPWLGAPRQQVRGRSRGAMWKAVSEKEKGHRAVTYTHNQFMGFVSSFRLASRELATTTSARL